MKMMEQLNFLQGIGLPEQVSSDIFDYRPAVFSKAECDEHLQSFLQNVPWSQTTQFRYGKKVLTPRLSAWYGDPTADSSSEGSSSPMLPWTAGLLEIKAKVETLSGIAFNSVLLNYYRDGNDSVAWHSDRDGVPGRNKYVASVSFGQVRPFDLRHKSDPTKAFTVLLENGSYLLMKGEFQDQWLHRIAKSRLPMGPRVNLTFRRT